MIMGVNRIFVDTNVLIYSSNALSPWRETALTALQKARNLDFELVTSRQVLREYLVAMTQGQSPQTMISVKNVLENVSILQHELTVVGGKHEILTILLDLVQKLTITGKQIYNANIVATMLAYDIEHLLTHNVEDFQNFTGRIHILSLEEWART